MASRLIPKAPQPVHFVDLKKSAGILDDYAVRKNVATKEGTIEHVPTEDNHIVNKKYVDDEIAGISLVETDPIFSQWLIDTPPLYSFTESDPLAVLATGARTGATSQSQSFTKGITLNATSIVTDTTTGLKIGTATNQKLGFFNATPVVQQTATTDLGTVLSNLGLRASGTAYPITTSGAVNLSGATTLTGATIIDRTDAEAFLVRKAGDTGDVFTVDTTNSKIIVGGATHQIGFTGQEDNLVFTTALTTSTYDFKIPSDTYGYIIGAGGDAKIIYDGTNMVIDPKVVGSGYLSILGSVVLDTNETLALSGTGYVDSPKYKAGGTAPVADGTYTVGIGGTTNGTITIKGGIITAVQEAVA